MGIHSEKSTSVPLDEEKPEKMGELMNQVRSLYQSQEGLPVVAARVRRDGVRKILLVQAVVLLLQAEPGTSMGLAATHTRGTRTPYLDLHHVHFTARNHHPLQRAVIGPQSRLLGRANHKCVKAMS